MKSLTVGCLFLLALAASGAWASPLCTDQTASGVGGNKLNYYVALGSGGCEMNGLLFYSFSYSYTLSGSGSGFNQQSTKVTVTPSAANTALSFGAGWVIDGSQVADLTISYYVMGLGDGVNSMSNSFTYSTAGTPSYTFNANCTGGTCADAPTGTVFTNTSIAHPVVIALSQGPLLITNTAHMNALGSTSNNVHLSVVYDQFGTAAVPEPATYGMFGFGLAALVYLRRRRK